MPSTWGRVPESGLPSLCRFIAPSYQREIEEMTCLLVVVFDPRDPVPTLSCVERGDGSAKKRSRF